MISLKPILLAIHGASGRNGLRLIALGSNDPQVRLIAAIVSPTSDQLGEDAGTLAGLPPIGLLLSTDWPKECDAVIDFSKPAASLVAIEKCAMNKTPIAVATTGFSVEQLDRIKDFSNQTAICFAPNMSVAVNVAMKLVEQASRSLKNSAGGVDVEIIERHHRMKEDSPSGTALKFGQIIASEMGMTEHTYGREGLVGKRSPNEIGYHAVRLSDDPGQHTICFGMMGEIIEIRVGATNRDPYASGAILAAKWLQGKPPGLYSMFDVLGLNS